MRALVIDDSKPVRSILAKMLREFGFETTEAANGRDGLKRLRELGSAELATVNWRMPEMDGLEFLRAVRVDPRFRQIRLLMISGESEPSDVAAALAAGANDYIVKPCTKPTLQQKLTQLGLFSVGTDSGGKSSSAKPHFDSHSIRVLIVDDSVIVRRILSSELSTDAELEVVGTAADGQIALDALSSLKPDVVLLDVEMPNLNGLQTLQALRKTHPGLPVIMFSSLTERGAAVTVDALLRGANDYVSKPGGTHMKDAEAGRRVIRDELVPKIKQLCLRRTEIGGIDAPVERTSIPARLKAKSQARVDVVAIAVSTGGPCALAKTLPTFAVNCPVPILIVQHMPAVFTKHLADRLAAGGKLNVHEGSDGEYLQAGQVRIAPGGFHMTAVRCGGRGRVRLNQDAPVNGCRPSADVMFQSVARLYGNATLAVVMTGMGNDGLLGCKIIRQAGGLVLVQDEATSVVWGMPGHVARAGLADMVLPLDQLGREIARRIRRRT